MATSMNPARPQEDNNMAKMQDALRDKGGQLVDKAKDIAADVADRAKDVASSIAQKAEDATHAVGSGIQSLGSAVREKLPHSGVVGAAASTLAGGLESGGHYLKEEGLKGIGADLTNMIRRNPVPAMLVGVAIGFIIARASARS
jgi:ElaB/YqjD/DUF883 family membrane-anchored ribosome-binding protein